MGIIDSRSKDVNWRIDVSRDNTVEPQHACLAVLMDIRDELKSLNRIIGCHNCTGIPAILRMIERNTKKKRRKKK